MKSTKRDTLEVKSPQLELPIHGDANFSVKHDSCIDKGQDSTEHSYGDSAFSCNTNVTDNHDKKSTTFDENMLSVNMKPLCDNYKEDDLLSVDKISVLGSRGETLDRDVSFDLKVSKREKKIDKFKKIKDIFSRKHQRIVLQKITEKFT